jgi:hypothetical protein
MAKLRLPGHHGILATLPDESRYGENRGKKKRLSEENPVGEVFGGGVLGQVAPAGVPLAVGPAGEGLDV